jgi:hypothetical protein
MVWGRLSAGERGSGALSDKNAKSLHSSQLTSCKAHLMARRSARGNSSQETNLAHTTDGLNRWQRSMTAQVLCMSLLPLLLPLPLPLGVSSNALQVFRCP